MVPRSGIEPPTPPLPRACSTPELPRPIASGAQDATGDWPVQACMGRLDPVSSGDQDGAGFVAKS